jgi:hypothetical protein
MTSKEATRKESKKKGNDEREGRRDGPEPFA